MAGAAKYGDPCHRSTAEIKAMADHLARVGDECDYDLHAGTNIPIVRCVDFEGNFTCLKTWLVRVWRGELFSYNHLIVRLDEQAQRKRYRNRRLWQLFDDIEFAEMNYWSKFKDEETDHYPDISKKVFR